MADGMTVPAAGTSASSGVNPTGSSTNIPVGIGGSGDNKIDPNGVGFGTKYFESNGLNPIPGQTAGSLACASRSFVG